MSSSFSVRIRRRLRSSRPRQSTSARRLRRRGYVVIKATTECTGTGTLTLTLEQSDEAAANFSTALVTGALTADELNAGVALHLPIKHKRYLRLKGAASTTALTAGAVTCYLSDVFDARFIVPKEGIEFIATTD